MLLQGLDPPDYPCPTRGVHGQATISSAGTEGNGDAFDHCGTLLEAWATLHRHPSLKRLLSIQLPHGSGAGYETELQVVKPQFNVPMDQFCSGSLE